MSRNPRKPRYAVGDPVTRFVVRKLLGRRPQGPANPCVVWWYRLACRACGTERDASQPVLVYAQQGRALGCKQCRAVELEHKAMGIKVPEPEGVDPFFEPSPVAKPAPWRAGWPPSAPGPAAALWLAAMGVA